MNTHSVYALKLELAHELPEYRELQERLRKYKVFSPEHNLVCDEQNKFLDKQISIRYGETTEEYGNDNYRICLTDKGFVLCYYTDTDSGGYDCEEVVDIFESKEEFLNNFSLPSWSKQ